MVVAVLLGSCVSFGPNPDEVRAFLSGGSPHGPRELRYELDGHPMHAVEAGDPGLPTVLFVHGAPGSWDAFLDFLRDPELLGRARLVSVDRPGYGGSGRGRHEASLGEQARLLAPLLLGPDGTPRAAILVGHSLGGPVIARLAMDFPDRVAGLVFVAPSIDPALEETKWYQRVAEWPLVRRLVPVDLRTTNREILPLRAELEAMLPRWSSIRARSIVIQGENDSLVPPANADFAARMLTGAPVEIERIPGLSHFVPWERPELIRAAVLRLLDPLPPEPRRPVSAHSTTRGGR